MFVITSSQNDAQENLSTQKEKKKKNPRISGPAKGEGKGNQKTSEKGTEEADSIAMLPKENRLQAKYDYRRVKRIGKGVYSPYFTLLYAPTKDPMDLRFGFVASSKLDKRATQRNRARRLMREAVRKRLSEIEPGYDIILIAKNKIKEAGLAEVSSSLDQVLSKISLLRPRDLP